MDFKTTGFDVPAGYRQDYSVFNLISEEIYKTTYDGNIIKDLVITPNEKENTLNGYLTKVPKLILSPSQAFFKIVVNFIITLLICKAQISETFYSYKRMRKYMKEKKGDENYTKKRDGEERTGFDTALYWFIILICWADVAIACKVI